jgi:KipI family sensor histidine kinase inhibitor
MGTITPASDCALLVSFGEKYSEDVHRYVRALVQTLQHQPELALREIQPSCTSVLVRYDSLKISGPQLTKSLQSLLKKLDDSKQTSLRTRHIEIPVCYGPPFAPDIEDVARATGLTIDEVIQLHTSAEYTVCFFGFMPGFSYWSGLPEKLAVPRLATPRLKVPAGSVGIGGTQTGIYPLETPGGWRIIGRTPLKMFDPSTKQLCYLQLGDRVRLTPITLQQFNDAGGQWES